MSYNDLRKGRYSEPGGEYFITFVVHQRQPLFMELLAARTFIRELAYSEQQHHCQWLAWVLMPDHFHGLLSLDQPDENVGRASARQPPLNNDLSEITRTLRGRSAHFINKALQRQGKLWQTGFHDHALRAEEDRLQIARYIVANPLRAGLVNKIGEWPHWDSVWL